MGMLEDIEDLKRGYKKLSEDHHNAELRVNDELTTIERELKELKRSVAAARSIIEQAERKKKPKRWYQMNGVRGPLIVILSAVAWVVARKAGLPQDQVQALLVDAIGGAGVLGGAVQGIIGRIEAERRHGGNEASRVPEIELPRL